MKVSQYSKNRYGKKWHQDCSLITYTCNIHFYQKKKKKKKKKETEHPNDNDFKFQRFTSQIKLKGIIRKPCFLLYTYKNKTKLIGGVAVYYQQRNYIFFKAVQM